MTTESDKHVQELLTTDAERGKAMIAKCDEALKALGEAHSACVTMVESRVLRTVGLQPDRRDDQKLALELISDASDFAAATRKLRTARALFAYANRPE